MRKILLTLFIGCITYLSVNSQTAYWQEDFNSATDWQIEGNWSVTSGMLQFYWDPSISNFDMSAVSPEIQLPDAVDELIVTQYVEPWVSGVTDEMAEIFILHGSDETILWSWDLTEGTWGFPEGTEISFSVADYAGETVQFKFRTYGSSTYNWNWWNVFEMSLTAYYDNDLAVQNIYGPNKVEVNEQGTWAVDIKNLGVEVQNSYLLKLINHKSGDELGSYIITEPIQPGEMKSYNFVWTPVIPENTAIFGCVVLEDDEFESNNNSQSHFVRIEPDMEYNVLLWDLDNSIQTVIDPEKGDLVQPHMGIVRALDNAGIQYDYYTYLPGNLIDYDMILATLGNYCLS